MKKISLLSLVLTASCADWITAIPDDFIVAEAGPASVDTGSGCGVDEDGDGYVVSCDDDGIVVDCDDNDPDIYPGAEEVCGDGRDNNCNGQADEECGPIDAGSAPVDSGSGAVDAGVVAPPPVFGRNRSCSYDSEEGREGLKVCLRFNSENLENEAPDGYGFDQVGRRYETLSPDNSAFHVSASNHVALQVPEDGFRDGFLLATWIKRSRNDGTVYSSRVNDGTSAVGPFALKIDNGQVLFEWGTNSAIRSSIELSEENYYHVMVSYDASDEVAPVRLFVDGEQQASARSADRLSERRAFGAGLFFDGIGVTLQATGQNRSGTNSFNGWIDDLRVWDLPSGGGARAKSREFLTLEAGRYVERFQAPDSLAGFACSGSGPRRVDNNGNSAAGFTVPCSLRIHTSAAPQISSVRFRAGITGQPIADSVEQITFHIGSGGQGISVIRSGLPGERTFGLQRSEEEGPVPVSNCEFGVNGNPEITVEFDWLNRQASMYCYETDNAEIDLPMGMNGADTFSIDPGDAANSGLWIDDLIWSL